MWDADHLDFFKDLEDVKRSFRRFAELVPQGAVWWRTAMTPTLWTPCGIERPMLTFGLEQGTSTAED